MSARSGSVVRSGVVVIVCLSRYRVPELFESTYSFESIVVWWQESIRQEGGISKALASDGNSRKAGAVIEVVIDTAKLLRV